MKKKGISLVSISVAITIMVILVSTISISLNYSINNARKMTFAKEIYNIQSLVNEYVKDKGELPKTIESIKIDINSNEQFESKTLFQVLDLSELGIKNTTYGNKESNNPKDIYAISDTGKVYYMQGFKTQGKTYYTLTDDLKQMIEKKQNLAVNTSTIEFKASAAGWSSEGVQVEVIIPQDCTSPTVMATNNVSVSEATILNDNSLRYIVNSNRVITNYTITVTYTKNGKTSNASYLVKTDNIPPLIYKDENIANTETKLKGIKASDFESGLKYFKYAEMGIDVDDVVEYMKSYGKTMRSGELKFENGKTYTLYAEDNAGNYRVKYIDGNGNLLDIMPNTNL